MLEDVNKTNKEELFEWLKDLKEKDPMSFTVCMGMLYGYAMINRNISVIDDKTQDCANYDVSRAVCPTGYDNSQNISTLSRQISDCCCGNKAAVDRLKEEK